MSLAWIPNAITILRVVLVAPTAWFLWQGEYVSALVLMIIASVSDALDGALARQFHWMSELGAALDPVADKLLVAVLFFVLAIQQHIPLWVAIIVLGRDAIIFAGAIAYRILFAEIELSPTLISKANTALQLLMLVLVLVGLCEFGMLSEITMSVVDPYLFVLLAGVGLASGVDYVVTWGARAFNRKDELRPASDRPVSNLDHPVKSDESASNNGP